MAFNISSNHYDQIRGWLDANAKELVNKEGAICTNFVLIGEYIDSDNEWYTLFMRDESLPPWRATGLVDYAMSNEFDSNDNYDMEDDC